MFVRLMRSIPHREAGGLLLSKVPDTLESDTYKRIGMFQMDSGIFEEWLASRLNRQSEGFEEGGELDLEHPHLQNIVHTITIV